MKITEISLPFITAIIIQRCTPGFIQENVFFLPENNFEIISITIGRLIPNYWEQNLLPSIFGHTQCAGLSSLGHWPLATGQDSSQ